MRVHLHPQGRTVEVAGRRSVGRLLAELGRASRNRHGDPRRRAAPRRRDGRGRRRDRGARRDLRRRRDEVHALPGQGRGPAPRAQRRLLPPLLHLLLPPAGRARDRRRAHVHPRASASWSPSPAARTASRCGTSWSSSATRPPASTSARHRRLLRPLAARRSRRSRAARSCRCGSSTSPPRDRVSRCPTSPRSRAASPCSACGTIKRHYFDAAALDGGFDVLATGHNLDDEAARLLGNVLHWQRDHLARQRPVLPPTHPKFVRKVKPLYLLSEYETAVYAFMRGIDYVVEECPNSRRRDAARLQGHAQPPRGREPGHQARLRARVPAHRRSRCSRTRADERDRPRPARAAACPPWGDGVRVLPAGARRSRRKRARARRRAGGVTRDRRASTEGDRARCATATRSCSSTARTAPTCARCGAGGRITCAAAPIACDDVIGRPEGIERGDRVAASASSCCGRRTRS